MTPADRVRYEAPRILFVVGENLTVLAALDGTDAVRLQTVGRAVAEMANTLRLHQSERAAAARRGVLVPIDVERLARKLRNDSAYAKDSVVVMVAPEMKRRKRKRTA